MYSMKCVPVSETPSFSWECPYAIHFRAPSLLLVKLKKCSNNENCRRDLTQKMMEVA